MLINQRHGEFSLLFDPKPAEAGDTVLLFEENTVLLRTEPNAGRLPLWKELKGLFPGIAPLHAFTQGTRRFFIANVDTGTLAPPGFTFEAVRTFRSLLPEEDAALLIAAWHLLVWYREHRFCGLCGGAASPATAERALVCGRCAHIVYPSILPAVIVAVTHGSRLLLARNAHSVWNHFSLIAGYVEVGETAEQAVRREVMEEVGLRIKNIRYAASQPWGLSQSLMLGFTAELDGSPVITLQESELSEAHWFSRADIPLPDSRASISSDLMEGFRSGLIGTQD